MVDGDCLAPEPHSLRPVIAPLVEAAPPALRADMRVGTGNRGPCGRTALEQAVDRSHDHSLTKRAPRRQKAPASGQVFLPGAKCGGEPPCFPGFRGLFLPPVARAGPSRPQAALGGDGGVPALPRLRLVQRWRSPRSEENQSELPT